MARKDLLFYELESLSSKDAILYHDFLLPLMWEDGKGVVVAFQDLHNRYKTLLDCQRNGYIKFKDPNNIVEFLEIFSESSCPLEEFRSDWGTIDFSRIKEIGTPTEVYSTYYAGLTPYYPEFMLDMGEYLEEQLGQDLGNGIGALPVSYTMLFLSNLDNLVTLFISKEKYLMGEEILNSREHKASVAEKTLQYFLKLSPQDNIFKGHTLRHLNSEVQVGEAFHGVIEDIEVSIRLCTVKKYVHNFKSKVFRDTGYFLHTYFSAELLDEDLSNFKLSSWLRQHLTLLLDSILTDFYGSGSYLHALILTDDYYVKLEVQERRGGSIVFKLSTTIAID